MIPAFTHSGVLPPYDTAIGPVNPAAMAPYVTTASALTARFATSPERVEILKGLLVLRGELHRFGITQGFQWLNGSFVEDVETTRGAPPQDIDVVTFFWRPRHLDQNALVALANRNPNVFTQAGAKTHYHVDAYFQQLEHHPEWLVKTTRYWFGLFSHTRTDIWKGMLEIPLLSDDFAAVRHL